jgi:hypothetical protein
VFAIAAAGVFSTLLVLLPLLRRAPGQAPGAPAAS